MLRRVIENATMPLRWPMYVRNVKQLLRAADSSLRRAALRVRRHSRPAARVAARRRPAARARPPGRAPRVPGSRAAAAGDGAAGAGCDDRGGWRAAGAGGGRAGRRGRRGDIEAPVEAPARRRSVRSSTPRRSTRPGPPQPAEGEAGAEAPADAKPKRKRAAAGAKKTGRSEEAPRDTSETPGQEEGVTEPVAFQIAAAEGDDGEWAARLMAASDPWITLGRGLDPGRAACESTSPALPRPSAARATSAESASGPTDSGPRCWHAGSRSASTKGPSTRIVPVSPGRRREEPR